jgi:hypothetical protein
MSLAVAVVLRHEPQNATARAIWTQLLQTNREQDLAWLDPGVKLAPAPQPGVTSVSHDGFTWTFQDAEQVGTFCTGEPWVVGPVTVVGITPAPTNVGGRQRNGSMVNPRASTSNGYDSESFWNYNDGKYQAALNVALQIPMTFQTGSLVSARSGDKFEANPEGESFLINAAVLTGCFG